MWLLLQGRGAAILSMPLWEEASQWADTSPCNGTDGKYCRRPGLASVSAPPTPALVPSSCALCEHVGVAMCRQR